MGDDRAVGEDQPAPGGETNASESHLEPPLEDVDQISPARMQQRSHRQPGGWIADPVGGVEAPAQGLERLLWDRGLAARDDPRARVHGGDRLRNLGRPRPGHGHELTSKSVPQQRPGVR